MLEPDLDDQLITRSVFASLDVEAGLRFFNYSNELFDCLAAENHPDLILITLRSVPENGLQVLTRLKANKDFKYIPVIVLSDASFSNVVKECYELGANSFIQKPFTGPGTEKKISLFLNYWFEVTELPQNNSNLSVY